MKIAKKIFSVFKAYIKPEFVKKEKYMNSVKSIGTTPNFCALKIPKNVHLGANFSKQEFMSKAQGILNTKGEYSLCFQSQEAESEALTYFKARGIVLEQRLTKTIKEFVEFAGL